MTAFCGRKMLSISESIDDMAAYSQLSDAIYYQILHSTNPALEEVSILLTKVTGDSVQC